MIGRPAIANGPNIGSSGANLCRNRLTPSCAQTPRPQTMKPKDQAHRRSLAAAEDALLRLEMKIAQRADELWKNAGKARGNDLEHWLQAEREAFVRFPARA
jgi:hypothetical protein